MNEEDLELAGALITGLDKGPLRSVEDPDTMEDFRSILPPEKLTENIAKYHSLVKEGFKFAGKKQDDGFQENPDFLSSLVEKGRNRQETMSKKPPTSEGQKNDNESENKSKNVLEDENGLDESPPPPWKLTNIMHI